MRPRWVRLGAWTLCVAVLGMLFAPRTAVSHSHDEHGAHVHLVGVLSPSGTHAHRHGHDLPHLHLWGGGHGVRGQPAPDVPAPVDEESVEIGDWVDSCAEAWSARAADRPHHSGVRIFERIVCAQGDAARPWRPPVAIGLGSPPDADRPESPLACCLATVVLLN